MKKGRIAALILSMAILMTGCGGAATDATIASESAETESSTGVVIGGGLAGNTTTGEEISADGNYKDELHIAFNAQPQTLDAQLSSAQAVGCITRGVYEELVALTTNFEAKPMLAESIDVNENSTEYVFHLRQGVLFHNGEEMKAKDVVASMNRWIDNFSNAKVMAGENRFEEVDSYTVKITFDKPAISFLGLIAGGKQVAAIMPKSVIDNATETGVTEYIGTGPYKFSEWKMDQYILLEKFDDYQPVEIEADGYAGKKEALTQKVYFDFVSDASTRLSGIQSGEYDITVNLPIDNYEIVNGNPDLVVDTALSMGETVILNKKAGLCINEKFRQAILAAMNMDDIMLGAQSNELFYRVDSSYMFVEQENWYSMSGSEYFNQGDTEKAKELLSEAGYNGEAFRLIVSQAYPEFYNAGLVIKTQLEAVGVSVDLIVVDWATQQQMMYEEDQYDAFITGFTPVTTPTELLYLSPEWAGWTTDENIQEYATKITGAATLEEAENIWQEMQGYCWESVPVIKLGDSYSLGAHNNKVKGYTAFMGPIVWNTVVEE